MAKSAKDDLLARIDADIADLQRTRDYITAQVSASAEPEPKKRGRGKGKKGLPAQETDGI